MASNVPHHAWPKPLFKDGKVYDAPNQKEYDAHMQDGPSAMDNQEIPAKGYGWSPTYIHQEFPKAMHGKDDKGNDVSVSVQNKKEMKVALENGWSLRPLHDAPTETAEIVLSHLTPPPNARPKDDNTSE